MIKKLLIAIACCVLTVANAYELPDLPGNNGMTPWQEQEYGKQFFAYIKANMPLVKDPLINDYITNLGFRLVSVSKDPSRHFYFFIPRDNSVNAFAGPDGYVAINSGLILFSQKEGELAAVMAHEISHVTQRHIARAMQKATGPMLASLGAILGAILIGNPDLAAGTATTGIAASSQLGISYTRAQEKEADRVGIKLLAKAGFNPEDMAKMFKLMQSRTFSNTPSRFEFLSTHPFFNSRIADAEDQASDYAKKPDRSFLQYHLVKARLASLLTGDPAAFLQHMQKQLKPSHHQAIRYGYALALADNQKYTEAKNELKKLIQEYPSEIFYPYSLAETQVSANQIKSALQTLKTLDEDYPYYYPVIMLYGQTLLQAKQPKAAVDYLKPYYDDYHKRLSFLSLYSHALGQAGDLAQGYIIRARAYLLLGQKTAAQGQIETALKLDHLSAYERKSLQGMLKEVKR